MSASAPVPSETIARPRTELALLVFGFLTAMALRVALLPEPGLRTDLDLFTQWVRWIDSHSLAQTYGTDVAFPPVMAYVFWIVGIVQPAFRTSPDAADPAIRIALKLPAVLADAGLVLGVAWLLRGRPGWAVVAALGVAFGPVVVYTSAWWGQYESVYVLAGLVAVVLAVGRRPYLAAVALGIALMAKPQGFAFLPPFAAYAWALLGPRRTLLAGLATVATITVLWLPFVPEGGPLAYLAAVEHYQTGIYALLSVNAWNPWWILQSAVGGGRYVADASATLGPLSPRILGFVLLALAEIGLIGAVARAATPRSLLLGLAASVLVTYDLLTGVHERYSYGALIFLAPLIPDRRVLLVWLGLNLVIALNLLAAVPPSPAVGAVVPVGGAVGLAGSLALIGLTVATVGLLLRARLDEGPSLRPDAGGAGRGEPGAPETRGRTSGDSAAASSEA